jgi:hypothetical protein
VPVRADTRPDGRRTSGLGSCPDGQRPGRGGANDAILRIDSALTSVSGLRSTLGAIQNRFDSTINSLQAVSENLSASRSRIQDTDFAAETAALTRAQILQQAGTAMVAQANYGSRRTCCRSCANGRASVNEKRAAGSRDPVAFTWMRQHGYPSC